MSNPLIYNTVDDCLAPGDVRAIKQVLGFANGSGATVAMVAPVGGGPAVPARQDFTVPGALAPGAAGSPLNYFLPFMNDAVQAVTPGVGLQLNPGGEPFTHTVDQDGILTPGSFFVGYPFFDHVKYAVATPPIAPPIDGRELVFTVESASKLILPSGPNAFPAIFAPYITDLPSDNRLGILTLACIDPSTFSVFNAQVTNATIYAQHERVPILKPAYGGPLPDYASFSNFYPVARRDPRNPLGDFAKIAIAFNAKEGYVRWLVDGQEVHRLFQPGFPGEHRYRVYDYGNPANVVSAFPTQLQFVLILGDHLDQTRLLDQAVDDGAAATNKPLVALWGVRANSVAPPPVVGSVVQPPDVYYDPVHVTQGNGPTAGQPVALFAPDFADPTSAIGNRIFGQGVQAVIRSWDVSVI